MVVDVTQPLKPTDARRLIDAILASSFVQLSNHAVKEMEKDDLDMGDALNILRAGIVREPEWENGEWRYHVETPRMTFIIAFESETTLVIVTAWRKRL
jgi:hypothetical protein